MEPMDMDDQEDRGGEEISSLLEAWGLQSVQRYASNFEANEVDMDTFVHLDTSIDSVRELIPQVGPRVKFLRELRKWKEMKKVASLAVSASGESVPNIPPADASLTESSSSIHKTASFDIRGILQRQYGGDAIIKEFESGLVSTKSRISAVRILVWHLISEYGEKPPPDVKLSMAKAIFQEFPKLVDKDGAGYDAWFKSGKGRHSATGYLEERLRNVRKRSIKPSQPKVNNVPTLVVTQKSQNTTTSIDNRTDMHTSGDLAPMVPLADARLTEPSSSISKTSFSEQPTNASLPKKRTLYTFDVRGILGRHYSGDTIIQEFENGVVSNKSRISAVRILVWHLITECGENPSSDAKLAMAKAIFEEFPKLTDKDGAGYEAWYKPCSGRHCATGYLEVRLRNWRKRSMDRDQPKLDYIQAQKSLKSTTSIDYTTDMPTCGDSMPRVSASDVPLTEPSSSKTAFSEQSTSASLPNKQGLYPFDIRGILKRQCGGEAIIQDFDSGLVSNHARISAVRIFVSHLISEFGGKPSSDVKLSMAKAIIEEFPSLVEKNGAGYEAWFKPCEDKHSATGYLEQRLRNVRRRSRQPKPDYIQAQESPNSTNSIDNTTDTPTSGDPTPRVPASDVPLTEPSSSKTAFSEQSTSASLPKKRKLSPFDIRGILGRQSGGDVIIQDFEKGWVTYRRRISAVRILVSHLVSEYGERPSSDIKLAMAKAIVEEFPKLKDKDGAGYEAWFKRRDWQHPATGYLEERLKYLRKKAMEREQPKLDNVPTQTTLINTTEYRPDMSASGDSVLRIPTSDVPKKQKLTRPFDIRGVLERQDGGDAIIQDFENGLLSYKSRISAVRILVWHLISEFGDRPSSDIKLAMAKAIVEEFPKLKDKDGAGYEAWYTPCSVTCRRHSATGFLEERLRNVRRRLKPRQYKVDNVPTQTNLINTTSIDYETDVTEEDASQMLSWLKDNKEPLTQVQEYMEKTAKTRAKFISDHPEESTENILNLFPRLIDVPGMIEQDFRIIFPDVADNLFVKWEKMAAGILEYAEKQKNWRQFLKLPDAVIGDEDVENLACLVLPCILPTGARKVKGKFGRCSISEAISSFIAFKPIGTNVSEFLEADEVKQPYILTIGDSILRPEQTFVIVEKQAIPQDSLLKAVDVCFKLFYILDIAFPWQALSTWEFFQKVVYGFGEGKGRNTTSACVLTLRAFLLNN